MSRRSRFQMFFRSLLTGGKSPQRRRKPALGQRRRPAVEQLEIRALLAGLEISVADATVNEIGSASAFVATGSGGLSSPKDLVLGSDGNLYVASSGTNSVLRYNGSTGQLIGTFVTASSGGLTTPFGLAFGPDGNLYVGSQGTSNAILRYSGTTGTFINTYVPTGFGGLNNPTGIAFGTDGNLYVSSAQSASILRYQGPSGPNPGSPLPSTGQTGAAFVATGSGGLDYPTDLVFGPDGNLYVASRLTDQAVLKFDGMTGSFITTYVSPGSGGLGEPRGLAFDQDGRLYVADVATNAIHRFDNQGQYLDDPVASSLSTLRAPIGMTLDAQGSLLISSRDTNAVVRYDRGVVVTLSAASPTPVSVTYVTADGSATSADYSAQAGTVTFAPGQTSRRVLLAAKDDVLVEANESFTVQLSNPTGGTTIADSSAVVTIVDDDAARQMTITDASAIEGDHTAHYRGAFVDGSTGGHFNPLTFGPDGNLYTAVGTGAGYNTVQRYNGATGQFIDTFVPQGRINGVRDMVFRGGYMYVASAYTDEVLRYDVGTGAFVDVFVAANSGGIDHPDGMAFGPDANNDGIPELYVTGWLSHSVVRYDGLTGQPLGTYVAASSGGLSYPFALAFGTDGIYVTSAGTNQILKYNSQTGAYLGVTASGNGLDYPREVMFGPDGLMYVSSGNNDRILRFTAAGAYVDDYVPGGAGGMDNPRSLVFGPDGDLYVTATGNSQILRFGTESEAVFTVSLSTPSGLPLTVDFVSANGSATAGSDYTATSGALTFNPGITSKTIRVPILNDALAENTETFILNLSNLTAASIADSQATGAITDDDATKFFVVDDASTNLTYRYGAPGNPLGNSSLNTGNAAPRGAASTAAGTTVWVVDANKQVYVYNASGVLQGLWTASGLNSQAQIVGIATNGTDIWLVDNKTDKVFKYAGAAGRLSGSQTATSSFSLNSGNTSPKDLVTDGVSIWVVNDSSTDKVFKYTVAGALLGSWTIDAGNTAPTGLTIDPANVSNLWIVDNLSDKVYQYTAAATRTSGSQSAALTFLLAASNSNAQGIADPPVPGTSLSPAPISASATTPLVQPVLAESFSRRPSGSLVGLPSEPVAGDRQHSERAADPLATRIIDQAIAGLVTHERVIQFGLSAELDLDCDLVADLASAVTHRRTARFDLRQELHLDPDLLADLTLAR